MPGTLADYYDWLTTAEDDAMFLARAVATIRRTMAALPAAVAGAPPVAWHQASTWYDWVTAPLAGWTEDAVPTGWGVSDLLDDFDHADPWRQTAPLTDLLYHAQFERLGKPGRRARGFIFTPRPIADHLVAVMAPDVLPPMEEPLRILDPAAGGGVFWEAVIAHRLARVPAMQRSAVYADLLEQHLYAIEVQPLWAAWLGIRARAAWYAYQLQQAAIFGEGLQLPPSGIAPHIHCGDALAPDALPADWPRAYDLIIGNPPYGFAEAMTFAERADLIERLEVARGPFDRCWVFTEQAIRWLRIGGLLGFLVPDAMFYRPRAQRVRDHINQYMRMRETTQLGMIYPAAIVSGMYFIAQRWHWKHDPEVYERIVLEELTGPDRHPCLGDFVTIRRGEEVGDSACIALEEDPASLPILRGRDLRPLAALQPVVGLTVPLRKSPDIYRSPKLLVVKTGATPLVALDLSEGYPTLQSVYVLHLREGVPEGVTLQVLAYILAGPEGQAQFRDLTKGKSLFPQLNQHVLASFVLPTLADIQALNARLQTQAPHYCATGVLAASEREALAEADR